MAMLDCGLEEFDRGENDMRGSLGDVLSDVCKSFRHYSLAISFPTTVQIPKHLIARNLCAERKPCKLKRQPNLEVQIDGLDQFVELIELFMLG